MKKSINLIRFALLVTALMLVATACNRDKNSASETGNLTGDLRNGSPNSTDTSATPGGVTNVQPSGESDQGDTGIRTKPEPNQPEPKTPPVLKIQVVQGNQEGDLDIYVTNISEQEITDCTMLLFEDMEVKVSPRMKPGQVAMCAVGGEIPEKLTFRSGQFDKVEFEIPDEPLEELDVSRFDWAEIQTPDDGSSDNADKNDDDRVDKDKDEVGTDDVEQDDDNDEQADI